MWFHFIRTSNITLYDKLDYRKILFLEMYKPVGETGFDSQRSFGSATYKL